MLVLCVGARPGEAVDGVEAAINDPPPHAGTGIRRRNLYWRNRAHTSYGRADGPGSREAQESLCWWLCSERGPDPNGGGGREEKKSKLTLEKNPDGAED